MSSLNQAFIKAYQRRGVAAPHIPLPPAAPAGDAQGEQAAPPRLASGEVRAFDRQAAAVPPSHLFSKSPLSAPLVGRYAADDVPPLETLFPAESKPGDAGDSADREITIKNLSEDFTVGRPSRPPFAPGGLEGRTTEALAPLGPDSRIASKVDVDLEPAYEVERFEWPAVITSLAGEADAELSALIGELLPDGRGTLLVTGCRRGEGRTSIALLISRHLARSGARVLVVDADFQRPGIAACLGTDAELGWEETITAAAPQQAMIESLSDRLVVLPLRQALDDAAQAAAALSDMRGELLGKFGVVCIDAGPLVEVESGYEIDFGDAPVTAAIVVRDVRHSRLEQSHAVGRKLVKRGVSRWAIIENFV